MKTSIAEPTELAAGGS